VIPSAADRERLHAIIYDELIQGRFEPTSRGTVAAIGARAIREEGVDSIVLGCTEFGLLMEEGDFPVPMFDTTEIHAQAAMDFALRG
jgi:aspartate racemase